MLKISLDIAKKVYDEIKKKISLSTYVVGSVRRELSIVKDIDIIVIQSQSQVSKYLIPLLDCVKSSGERYISGIYIYKGLKIPIDFWIVKKSELPFSMLHFTGPKSYNIRLRYHVKKKYGYKLNNYGLYYKDSSKKVYGSGSIKNEKDLVKFIDTTYYEPKYRH